MNIKPIYIFVIIALILGVAITLHERFIPPLTLEQEIEVALVRYTPNIKQYPHVTTIDKQSGEYLRFHVNPAEDVELDPAFGFAQKQRGRWTILNLGTGGDPTEFYTQYKIPTDLQQ